MAGFEIIDCRLHISATLINCNTALADLLQENYLFRIYIFRGQFLLLQIADISSIKFRVFHHYQQDDPAVTPWHGKAFRISGPSWGESSDDLGLFIALWGHCNVNGTTQELDIAHHALSWLHDDVIKWKHCPRHWPFVRGIHRPRWIPRTRASDEEIWCFLWSASE